VLSRFLARGPSDLTVQDAARRAATAMHALFDHMRGGVERFTSTGPLEAPFAVLVQRLRQVRTGLEGAAPLDPAAAQAMFARVRDHFLTQEGTPRSKSPYARGSFACEADWKVHRELVVEHAPAVREVLAAYRRDLNVLVSRGIWRMYRIAESEYRRTLDAHAVLDFADLLLRALDLLKQMEEFAQSRYRLESRYHHVLVDEFQDTSRAQWELVALLIASWGEGEGLASTGPLQPSVFIVGDRKQSIYGFRDADVSVIGEAARHIGSLRQGGDVRRSISRSFRSVPALLSFVNDLCHDIQKAPGRGDAFRYEEEDRFPVTRDESAALGIVAADTPEGCAERTAAEIARLLEARVTVRDRQTGVPRPVRAGDIAILFRTRESHREYESALAARGIQTYVYKGLGFFDADEIKDVLALLWYLADPGSNLRAAALMRSRFFNVPDEDLRRLAPRLADALLPLTAQWRSLVDRLPPAELLDVVLDESGYGAQLRGARFQQARENLKKMRALVRRIQNRGYATLGRIAGHLDRLAVGDESNAVIDALDAVNLMTVHAAKGLEFPIVFVVNLARGTGNRRDPIRVAADPAGDAASVAVGDFISEADEDAQAREQEETKRLLYVALTRARDRLYLGSALKDGRMQPGRGSLAEVLPISLLDQFTPAMAGAGPVAWRASSGTVHAFETVAGLRATHAPPLPEPPSATLHADFEPLTDAAPQRVSASDVVGRPFMGRQGDGRSDQLIGTLVHRLLQRFGFETSTVDPAAVRGMLRAEEMAGDDPAAYLERALAAYQALCAQLDVRALYHSGERLHEVPFTMHEGGRFLRGSIDCLVRTAPDRLTVLEFKTGRPRDEHRAQVELYREAASRLFPGCTVDARLVYAGEAALS